MEHNYNLRMKTYLSIIVHFIFFCMLILQSTSAQQKKYSLWYNRPAPNKGVENIIKNRGFPYDESWERWSLPIGNGYMGACIFGRTDIERIQLSEKTFGNKGSYGSGGFGNFAEIYIDIQHQNPLNYKRELCLNDAISTVSYQYKGINYTREYFANYPNNIIVVRLKADQPGNVSFTLRPILPYLREYDTEKNGRTGEVTAENDLLTMKGEVQAFNLPYEAQIKVIPSGGYMEAKNNEFGNHGIIHVQDADSVVLLISAKTAYQLKSSVFTSSLENKFNGNEHPHKSVSQCIQTAANKGYETLRKEHIADYKSFFNRVNLHLCDEVPAIPTDSLLHNYKRGKNNLYMDELLFQYGRYLLIASSRQGSLPPNLQGAWSQYEHAPWSGGYWHNINIQMNYWPVFNTNLAELFIPYVEYNEAFRESAREQAIKYIKRNNPDALSTIQDENGWSIGTGANAFSISAPGGHSGPGTGGFTTKLFWDYYDYTRDKNILKKHSYPAMIGMAKFLSKTLKPAEGGYLLADPSFSPEQKHDGSYYRSKGCAFDQGMIWESYHDVLKAASILNDKSPFIETVKEQIGKLDAIHIGESGQIKEYREEKKYSDIGDAHHRHISHLCALYPGTLINSETPKWLDAAIITLNNRGDRSTGWAMAHRLNLWARTKNGDRAYKLYQRLLRTGILENLWDTHPPFQIDGNFGATSGVAEMLLQSHEGYIEPLPALPSAWRDGHYEGLVARGNFVVSAIWLQGVITQMSILSRKGGECTVKYDGITNFVIRDNKGKIVKTMKKEKNMVRFTTKKGGVYYLVP